MLSGVFFVLAQTMGMVVVHPWEAKLQYFALLPGMSAYLIRAWAAGQPIAPGVMADPARVLPAPVLFLAFWIALPAGLAAVIFPAQGFVPRIRPKPLNSGKKKTHFRSPFFLPFRPPFGMVPHLSLGAPFCLWRGRSKTQELGVKGRASPERDASVKDDLKR